MPGATLASPLRRGEPPPPAARQRQRRAPTNNYLHVREVKGGAFQARVWLGWPICSLNLGLFTIDRWESREHAEWAAGRASREFRRRYRPGVTLREVLESLIRDRLIPECVLPPRVRRAEGGGYFGFVKKGGRVLRTEVFACPWRACQAMCELLEKEFPPRPNRCGCH